MLRGTKALLLEVERNMDDIYLVLYIFFLNGAAVKLGMGHPLRGKLKRWCGQLCPPR
jgi:hypothetical protein